MLQHLPTHYFVSAMCIITQRQANREDSDRGRVKSNRRNCKGNDARFGLYRMHDCIRAVLSFRRCFMKLWSAKAIKDYR